MTSTPFLPFTSSYAVLLADNVDTDQLIPARFLKTTERTGLGRYLLHDRRANAERSGDTLFTAEPPDARVLVAGANFGCGSSREHAVWALTDAGYRTIIAVSFADIFRANALGNGLLPIAVTRDVVDELANAVTSSVAGANHAEASVSVNLETQQVTLPGGRCIDFTIAPFARHCLLAGIDEMDFLLEADAEIVAFEAARARTEFA